MKIIKPVEVRIEGVKLTQFLNEQFVEMLEKNVPNIKFQHICFYIMEEKDGKEKVVEKLFMGHEKPEDENNKILNVNSTYPETLEKLLKVIDGFTHE